MTDFELRLANYQYEHGFEKTKNMVSFYSCQLIWENGVTICNDCGIQTEEVSKVRCVRCAKIAYDKAF